MYDQWIYNHEFSYIHARFLVFAFIGNPLEIFRKAYDALEPGGWFEIQDSTPLRSIDGSTKGTYLQKIYDLVFEAATKRGANLDVAETYKDAMIEAGFEDVKEVVFPWPIGTWAKNALHKQIGAWFHKDVSEGIEGIAMGLLTRMIGMAKEEVEVLTARAQEDMLNKNIHGHHNL
jgi:hypothetical protein